MECPNCHQEVESSAAFCGNCGRPMLGSFVPPAAPPYAVAKPAQHSGEVKALLAVLFGVVGLIGSAFMALLGLSLGLAGLIMGTMSHSGHRRSLSTVGLVLSSLAILSSLGVWTYTLSHDAKTKASQTALNNSPSVMSSALSTPCYSIGFVDKFNVSNTNDSCDMRAFNGETMDTSTDAYKVFASKSASIVNAGVFTAPAKKAIENDVKTNLAGYSIDSEKISAFAGSPSYIVVATNKSEGVTVAEAAVYHPVSGGDNIFILVHASAGAKADFSTLEAQWQWK